MYIAIMNSYTYRMLSLKVLESDVIFLFLIEKSINYTKITVSPKKGFKTQF